LASLVEAEQKGGKEVELFEEDEVVQENKTKKVNLVEFYGTQEMEKLIKKLEAMKVDIAHYDPVQMPVLAKKEKPVKAPYKLVHDKQEHEVKSLRELLHYVRAEAKRGMTIQRYKGLGEMNPGQLWETTMDPQRRTVLKVTLEDTVEADKMFTVLMGDQVAPRREFIENHALEVRTLDI
jgi:DNA gyrase subunit B